MEKKLDPFGVLVLSFVTAIGGGTIRDMLIGNLPVAWLTNETATIVIFASAIAAMFFSRYLKQFTTLYFYLMHWVWDYLPSSVWKWDCQKILVREFVLHWVLSRHALAE